MIGAKKRAIGVVPDGCDLREEGLTALSAFVDSKLPCERDKSSLIRKFSKATRQSCAHECVRLQEWVWRFYNKTSVSA